MSVLRSAEVPLDLRAIARFMGPVVLGFFCCYALVCVGWLL